MKRLFLLFLFLSGCGGLKVQCDNADEEALAYRYANNNTDPRNFEIFARQCGKYGYRVPSQEKFKNAYDHALGQHCANSHEYFLLSYVAYRKNGYPLDCPASAPLAKAADEIRKDAFKASLYRSTIEDKKRGKTGNAGARTPADAVAVGLLLTPITILNHYDAAESAKKLRTLAEKYGYMESDLW